MKKALLPVLAAVLILSSCKKDKDEAQPTYQLTKAEIDQMVFDFTYDEKNLLTRIDFKDNGGEPQMPFFINVNYADGKPVSVDMYAKMQNGSSNAYRNFAFGYDSRNNIAYTVSAYYNEDGQLPPVTEARDTVKFQYNADNKLTGWKNRWNENYETWTYDAQGNLAHPEWNKVNNGNGSIIDILEQRYDNAINPFRNLGLGQFIFAIVQDNYEYMDQLLSNNNPVSYKKDVKEFNNSITTSHYIYYVTRTNTLDANGVLATSAIAEKDEELVDGQVVDTYDYDPSNRKFTVIRK